MITLKIPHEPTAKSRPRFTRYGKAYTPLKTKSYEAHVHHIAKEYGLTKITAPVAITLIAVHTRPKYLSAKKYPDCRIIKTTKPDIDNLVKSTLDGLSKFFDDKLVWSLTAYKYYASRSEKAHVEISIDPVSEVEEVENPTEH